MKRINDYQKFRDEEINEEFLGALLASAKGAFKNFLNHRSVSLSIKSISKFNIMSLPLFYTC